MNKLENKIEELQQSMANAVATEITCKFNKMERKINNNYHTLEGNTLLILFLCWRIVFYLGTILKILSHAVFEVVSLVFVLFIIGGGCCIEGNITVWFVASILFSSSYLWVAGDGVVTAIFALHCCFYLERSFFVFFLFGDPVPCTWSTKLINVFLNISSKVW